MNIKTINQFRAAVRQGRWAWPGGYPTFFICSDGEALCHDCIRKERRQIIDSVANQIHDGWQVVGLDINWEDPELYCAHCDKRIESAYAEVEQDVCRNL